MRVFEPKATSSPSILENSVAQEKKIDVNAPRRDLGARLLNEV